MPMPMQTVLGNKAQDSRQISPLNNLKPIDALQTFGFGLPVSQSNTVEFYNCIHPSTRQCLAACVLVGVHIDPYRLLN